MYHTFLVFQLKSDNHIKTGEDKQIWHITLIVLVLYYNSANVFKSIWDFYNKNEMSILYMLNYFFKYRLTFLLIHL